MSRARGGAVPYARIFALLLLSLGLASCDDAANQGKPMRLLTLFDLGAALEATRSVADTNADVLPTGVSGALYTRGPEGTATFSLNVSPIFVEGEVGAYAASESWLGFDEVWLQPMYVLAATDDTGKLAPIPGQPSIFSVGPTSGFYSPFWSTYFATVPTGVAPEKYRSSAAIFADHLPLTPGPGRICGLAPPGVDVTGYQRSPADVPPTLPLDPAVGTSTVRLASGIVDGETDPTSALDFGTGRFTWSDNLVVDTTAMFVFDARDASGHGVALGLPPVGGTGGLGAQTPARESNGRPAFGSLWRLVEVQLPAGAGAIVPDSAPGATYLRARLASLGLVAQAEIPAAWSGLGNAIDYVERPVLNASTCFAATSPTSPSCQWIDSQAAVETYLSTWMNETDTLLAGPLVTYRGKAVP
jgi:hypothetical protein